MINPTAAAPAVVPPVVAAPTATATSTSAWSVSSATGGEPGAVAMRLRVRVQVAVQTTRHWASRNPVRRARVVGELSSRFAAGSWNTVAAAAAASAATIWARTVNDPASADGCTSRCSMTSASARTAAASGVGQAIERAVGHQAWRSVCRGTCRFEAP